MTCPFLREAQVKFCRTAAVRKLIPLTLAGKTEEKCSSGEHATCAVYQAHPQESDGAPGPCPYLRESLMQYCGAAPVAKFVPYSESLISRCGNDGFRYCELYLGMAHPATDSDPVDGIALPNWLRYSANHMWLDVTEDGVCHAGIDAFLSRALGKVDRISYVWQKGIRRPAAVLTVNGMDLEVVFPNPLMLTGCNLYLRADPGAPRRGAVHRGVAIRRDAASRHDARAGRRAGGARLDGARAASHERFPAGAERAARPMAGSSPAACRACSSGNRPWLCFTSSLTQL